MKFCIRVWLWCVGTAVLSGCGGLLSSDQPAEHVYWLEAVKLRFEEPRPGALPELVVKVVTLPGLDTDQILVKGPGARLNYYAGGRWPDHLPEVLGSILRLTLESSGRFGRVSNGSPMGRVEWTLDLELREFFAVRSAADTAPQVRVALAGYVNCGLGNTAIGAAANVSAEADRLSRIVKAFQTATNQVMIGIGEKLENHCFGEQRGAGAGTREP